MFSQPFSRVIPTQRFCPDQKPLLYSTPRKPSDYVRALIRKDRERQAGLSALRADLQLGVDQLDRGEGRPAEEVFKRLKARGKALAG